MLWFHSIGFRPCEPDLRGIDDPGLAVCKDTYLASIHCCDGKGLIIQKQREEALRRGSLKSEPKNKALRGWVLKSKCNNVKEQFVVQYQQRRLAYAQRLRTQQVEVPLTSQDLNCEDQIKVCCLQQWGRQFFNVGRICKHCEFIHHFDFVTGSADTKNRY